MLFFVLLVILFFVMYFMRNRKDKEDLEEQIKEDLYKTPS